MSFDYDAPAELFLSLRARHDQALEQSLRLLLKI
jgi:hypothetical protein